MKKRQHIVQQNTTTAFAIVREVSIIATAIVNLTPPLPNTVVTHDRRSIEVDGQPIVLATIRAAMHAIIRDAVDTLNNVLCGHDLAEVKEVIAQIHDPSSATIFVDDFSNSSDRHSPFTQTTMKNPLAPFRNSLVDKFFLPPHQQPAQCDFFFIDSDGKVHVRQMAVIRWWNNIDQALKVRVDGSFRSALLILYSQKLVVACHLSCGGASRGTELVGISHSMRMNGHLGL